MTEDKQGMIYAAGAYILWGFLPIYWKLMDEMPAGEILAHRIIWSFVFMICLILLSQKGTHFLKESRVIFKDKKKLIGISLAGMVISLNWLAYIWAVNSGHVIQASLGYYINPLISVLLGIVVLKERLIKRQLYSFILAGIAVIYLTVSYGIFPWISLVLALTFGLYGLLKKTVAISTMFGLAIETMVVTPVALFYLITIPNTTLEADVFVSKTGIFLVGAGIATAIPLLLFASGAKRIPLSLVGFLQYIAPTLMLILGIFVYQETFSTAHLVSFVLIWIALLVYLSSTRKEGKRTASSQTLRET